MADTLNITLTSDIPQLQVELSYVSAPPVVVQLAAPDQPTLVVELGHIGPKGDAGTGTDYTATAGEALSGNRLVYIEAGKAYYYNASDAALYGRTLGITTAAAAADDSVNIQMAGVIPWTSTPLTAGAVYYAGLNGELTTDVTGLTVIQRVGTAIATDKLKINFDINILTT